MSEVVTTIKVPKLIVVENGLSENNFEEEKIKIYCQQKLSKKFIEEEIQKDPVLIFYIMKNPYLTKKQKNDYKNLS